MQESVLQLINLLVAEFAQPPSNAAVRFLWDFLRSSFLGTEEQQLFNAFQADPNGETRERLRVLVNERYRSDEVFAKQLKVLLGDAESLSAGKQPVKPSIAEVIKKTISNTYSFVASGFILASVKKKVEISTSQLKKSKKKKSPPKSKSEPAKKPGFVRSSKKDPLGGFISRQSSQSRMSPQSGMYSQSGMSSQSEKYSEYEFNITGSGNAVGGQWEEISINETTEIPIFGAEMMDNLISIQDDTQEATLPEEGTVCYTMAEVDSQLLLKEEASVKVIISKEEIAKSAGKVSGEALAIVLAKKKLSVKIRPVINFEIAGNRAFEVDVPQAGSPALVTFKALPTHIGRCTLAVDVWQEEALVCSIQLSPQCVNVKENFEIEKAEAAGSGIKPFPKDINHLKINEHRIGETYYYDYEFTSRELKVYDNFSSTVLTTDRATFVSNLYKQIERLWETTDGDDQLIKQELKFLGAKLFTDLLPDPLKQILFANKDKIKSLQITSTEAYIPWELLLIKNPDAKIPWNSEDKFLGELGTTRWLFGTWPAEELLIRSGRARYLIPSYEAEEWRLKGGQKESAYLVTKFEAAEVTPDPLEVDKLLRDKGSFDLLHFCCHGGADSQNITHSQLLLKAWKEGEDSKYKYLTQTSVEQCGSIILENGVRPMIVLNACRTGRMGDSIVTYGGFANAFLQAGAGAFVGALWAIEDNSSVEFVTSFYDALLNGQTLSEATITARETASKEPSTTWMAYVIYGHPFAKLSIN